MMTTSAHANSTRPGSELVRRIVDDLLASEINLRDVTLDEVKARITDALRSRRPARERNRLVGTCCCDPALHG